MGNNTPTILQEPELNFTNDQLTDWVLYKNELPIIKNGELSNEEEDLDEKTVSAGSSPSNTAAGMGHCFFLIHFNYRGTDYTADVQKSGNYCSRISFNRCYTMIGLAKAS